MGSNLNPIFFLVLEDETPAFMKISVSNYISFENHQPCPSLRWVTSASHDNLYSMMRTSVKWLLLKDTVKTPALKCPPLVHSLHRTTTDT